jgi:hypothetical protein
MLNVAAGREALMTTDKNTCIACGSDLNEGVSICTTCGSYQSSWRNELRYWAAVAGVFSIVAATIGFSISAWPDIRKSLFWRDSLEVLQFHNSEGRSEISVFNTGDGPVWILELTYQAGDAFKQTMSVAKVVQADEVLDEVLFADETGEAVCSFPITVARDNTANEINGSITDEDTSVEYRTNPDPDLVEDGYGIPGMVNVRYLSLTTNDWYTATSDLTAIVSEHYDCD